jgi:hypothetical protein
MSTEINDDDPEGEDERNDIFSVMFQSICDAVNLAEAMLSVARVDRPTSDLARSTLNIPGSLGTQDVGVAWIDWEGFKTTSVTISLN